MADNVGYTPGSGATVAADDIAGVLYQRVKIGIGGDGSATDLSSANPMPIATPSGAIDVTVGNFPASQAVTGPLTDAQLRASAVPTSTSDSAATTSFGPITAANTVLFAALDTSNERTVVLQLSGLWSGSVGLQQSNDGAIWWDANGLSQSNDIGLVSSAYAPDVITVQVTARFFRAVTSADFSGSVSGTYVLRSVEPPQVAQNVRLMDVDPAATFPITAIDQNNYPTRIRANNLGHLVIADNVTRTDFRTSLGTVVLIDTTGYNSISLQLSGSISGQLQFQASNDSTTWTQVAGYPVGGSTGSQTFTSTTGHFIIPAVGRFFRLQITAYTSGTAVCVTTLKNQNSFLPITTLATNVSQLNGSTPINAGVAGTLAVGGNVAEDSAATLNPLICGGIARTALPASTIIAGDAIRQTFSISGQLVTKENAPGDLDFYVNATVTTNVQTQLRAAQAAGIRTNITSITYQNTNATATTLTIQDGAATTLITWSVPASMTEPRQLIFPTPLRGTAATALNYTAGTTGASVLLNVTGFNSY